MDRSSYLKGRKKRKSSVKALVDSIKIPTVYGATRPEKLTVISWHYTRPLIMREWTDIGGSAKLKEY